MKKKPELAVTIDDVVAEIRKINDERPDGFSTVELSEACGFAVAWCRTKLRDLIRSGRAECIGRRKEPRMDGSIGYTPIYRLIK